MAQSFLDVNGLYTPGLRFAWTNITDEEFISKWNGIPVVIKPRETIELSDVTPLPGMSMGHNLAVKFTKELVDKIMIGNAKLDEVAKNQPYYRSPQASSLGVPAMRKIWEDQILVAMTADEESPAMKMMREQMKAEILGGTQAEVARAPVTDNIPASVNEFADISKSNDKVQVESVPAKTKTIDVPVPIKNKGGRPKGSKNK